jgi:hypothetical protein
MAAQGCDVPSAAIAQTNYSGLGLAPIGTEQQV